MCGEDLPLPPRGASLAVDGPPHSGGVAERVRPAPRGGRDAGTRPGQRSPASQLPSRRTFRFSSTCYPETVFRIYIINCPSALPLASNGARLPCPQHPVAPHGFPEGPRGGARSPPRSAASAAWEPQKAPCTQPVSAPSRRGTPLQPFPLSNQQAFSLAYKMIRPWLDTETSGKIQVPCS